MKKKKLTIDELEQQIYGEGGLLFRVKDKIHELGIREVVKIMDVSTQSVYIFINYKRPKLETITKYARAVGVE